jgi:hypothetical protein
VPNTMEIAKESSLWTLVLIAARTWWNRRNTQPSNLVLPSSLSEDGSPPESPPPSPPIGWRSWVAVLDAEGRYCLWSPIYMVPWRGPAVRNEVPPTGDDDTAFAGLIFSSMVGPHEAMGFHAASTRERAEHYLHERCGVVATEFEPHEWRLEQAVLGQVECSGRIIEHVDGWRAQAMTVQGLIIFVDDKKLRRDLEERYQCDVTFASDRSCVRTWEAP